MTANILHAIGWFSVAGVLLIEAALIAAGFHFFHMRAPGDVLAISSILATGVLIPAVTSIGHRRVSRLDRVGTFAFSSIVGAFCFLAFVANNAIIMAYHPTAPVRYDLAYRIAAVALLPALLSWVALYFLSRRPQ